MIYRPVFVWLLTDRHGQRAVVLACDSEEAQQLAAEYTPDGPHWRGAVCEKIADTRRPSRVHCVIALEKPDAMKNLLTDTPMAKVKGRCEICGLDLTPGMNCPRCLNLIQ